MMNSPDAIPVGHRYHSRLSARVIRIVHLSDTHLQHNSLSPPRPISGNISIRRSIDSASGTNQIIDEVGFDAFERQIWANRSKSLNREPQTRQSEFYHKGGTFLSNSFYGTGKVNHNEIPCGDVLVHSGNFDWIRYSKNPFIRSRNFEELVQSMNDFFDRFPHKVKLYVPGNHDIIFEKKQISTIRERLTSIEYLLNSSFTYEGVKFYGTPYTPFRFMTNAHGFIRNNSRLSSHWQEIPTNTDVLITHCPPQGVLDLCVNKMRQKLPKLSSAWHRLTSSHPCTICNIVHPGREHFGCPNLRHEVLSRIK